MSRTRKMSECGLRHVGFVKGAIKFVALGIIHPFFVLGVKVNPVQNHIWPVNWAGMARHSRIDPIRNQPFFFGFCLATVIMLAQERR